MRRAAFLGKKQLTKEHHTTSASALDGPSVSGSALPPNAPSIEPAGAPQMQEQFCYWPNADVGTRLSDRLLSGVKRTRRIHEWLVCL
jgi:hypothetical protein